MNASLLACAMMANRLAPEMEHVAFNDFHSCAIPKQGNKDHPLTAPAARPLTKCLWKKRMIANSKPGITRAVDGVIYRDGIYDQIERIACPTLIIVGDQDVATEAEKSERMRGRIPNSKLVIIPGAGHTSTVEEPEAVNAALSEFLDSLK